MKDNKPILSDFDISTDKAYVGSTLSSTTSLNPAAGTLHYMAPELFEVKAKATTASGNICCRLLVSLSSFSSVRYVECWNMCFLCTLA